MRLATVISDCGLANYGPAKWGTLRDADWLLILREARPNTGLWRALHEILNYNREAVAKIWTKHHEDVYRWFIGPHVDDWLGTVPRDVVGIVAEYLRIKVTEPVYVRDGDLLGYGNSYFVMARRGGWPGSPGYVYSDKG